MSSYCNKDVAEFRSISRVLLGVRDLVVSEEEQSRDSRTDLEFFLHHSCDIMENAQNLA